MKRFPSHGAAALALALAALSAPVAVEVAHAQGEPQSVAVMRVETTEVANAWRASKVVGAKVVNDKDESVGTIDDLLIKPDDQVLFAVLSVGGFLGMGERLVVVPYKALDIGKEHVVLKGATKESLKDLPEFKYKTS